MLFWTQKGHLESLIILWLAVLKNCKQPYTLATTAFTFQAKIIRILIKGWAGLFATLSARTLWLGPPPWLRTFIWAFVSSSRPQRVWARGPRQDGHHAELLSGPQHSEDPDNEDHVEQEDENDGDCQQVRAGPSVHPAGSIIGINPRCVTLKNYHTMQQSQQSKNIKDTFVWQNHGPLREMSFYYEIFIIV